MIFELNFTIKYLIIILIGEKLMKDPLSSVDHIESKCEELRRTSSLLIEKIQKRNLLLVKARELMDRIDKVKYFLLF